jgi:hypothetical protein
MVTFTPFPPGSNLGDPGGELVANLPAAELTLQLLARVLVLDGKQVRQELEDRGLAAHVVEDGGELAAHRPGAEHQDAPGDLLDLQDRVGVVDQLVVDGDVGQRLGD